MALNVGELFVLFKLDSSGVTSGLNGISAKLNAMGTEFMQAGVLWKNYLTRPIMNFGKDAVKTNMEFTKEMAKTVAKENNLDLDTEEGQAAYEQLKDKAMDVAKTSIFMTSEVAGAYDKMAMAGWEWQSMLGALEPIMDLAAASAEDVVTVSDIVTDAMTAFGLTFENADRDIDTFQNDVEHFTDVLAAAATSSNTDVNKMGQSFKYVGAMAGTMGYKIDDVAVALGLMANRGTKASQAGTALRRVLQVLAAPTTDKQEAIISELGLSLTDENGKALDFMQVMQELRTVFQDMNIDVEGYTNKLTDLSDEYSDVIDAAAEFEKAGGKINEDGSFAFTNEGKSEQKKIATSDVQKRYKEYIALVQQLNDQLVDSQQNGAKLTQVQYATDLFGPRGMLALLAITQSSQEEFDNLVDAVYGSEGRTHEMKETMLDNPMGKLEMFRSSVDVLKTEIGELINKSLTPLLENATGLVDKFIGLDDETKESIIQFVGVAAAIGPVLIGVGLLAKVIGGLAGTFSFLSGPVGIVTALLAALAITALDTDGKLGKALGGIGEMLGIDMSDFSLEDLDIGGMLDGLLGGITDIAQNPAVTGFVERLGQGLVGALGSLGDIAGQIVTYIFSPEGLSKIWEAGKSLGDLLLKGIQYAVGGIFSFFSNLVDRILISWGLIDKEAYENHNQAITLGQQYRDTIIKDFAEGFYYDEEGFDAGEATESILEAAFLKFYGGNYDSDAFKQLASLFKENIRKAMGYEFEIDDDSAAYYLENMISNMWDKINVAASQAQFDDEIDFTGADLKGIMGGFLEQLGLSADYFTDEVYDTLAEKIMNGGLENENDIMTLMFSRLFAPENTTETAEEAKAKAIEAAQGVVDSVNEELNGTESIESTAQNTTASAVSGMETALTNEKDKVGTAAAEVSDEAVRQFLLTMSEGNGRLVASSYMTGIISGMHDSGVVSVASQIASDIMATISSFLNPENGYSVGLAFGTALANGISMGMSAGASLGFNAPSQITSVGAGGVVQGGAPAGDVVSAIKKGFSNVGVFLDSEKVGNGVTDVVSRNIAKEANSRSAESFIG